VFILVATVWPRISEWLWDRKSTLGPTFYNTWIPLLALFVFLLMGVAPLLGWRKTSPELFRKSFRWPVAFAGVVMALHLGLGARVGCAAFVPVDPIYDGALGEALSKVASTYPFVTVALVAFNLAVVTQEFVRGVAARRKSRPDEGVLAALVQLVSKSRRRYGGYVVHVGIALMFLGFAGRAWGKDVELSMSPGESVALEEYTVTYVGPRMETDSEKRMIFADVDVTRHGSPVGRISPAKYIYKASPQAPSTEVARHMTLRNDLYLVIGMVSPATKVAAFHIHVNTLISFMWIGAAVLLLGALVSMWPDVSREESRVFSYVRAGASVAASVAFAFALSSAASAPFYERLERDAPGAAAFAPEAP
jgi:cytochrome c-type biogenesis protein CcmF